MVEMGRQSHADLTMELVEITSKSGVTGPTTVTHVCTLSVWPVPPDMVWVDLSIDQALVSPAVPGVPASPAAIRSRCSVWLGCDGPAPHPGR